MVRRMTRRRRGMVRGTGNYGFAKKTAQRNFCACFECVTAKQSKQSSESFKVNLFSFFRPSKSKVLNKINRKASSMWEIASTCLNMFSDCYSFRLLSVCYLLELSSSMTTKWFNFSIDQLTCTRSRDRPLPPRDPSSFSERKKRAISQLIVLMYSFFIYEHQIRRSASVWVYVDEATKTARKSVRGLGEFCSQLQIQRKASHQMCQCNAGRLSVVLDRFPSYSQQYRRK